MDNQDHMMEWDLLEPIRDLTPNPFVSAEGVGFVDDAGRSYADFNEMCMVLGQNNAPYIAAMTKALNGITSNKIGFSPAKERLYRYFKESTHGDFSAFHLTTSGSEAVEWAVRLAKRITGRTEIISFWNSIHGRTYLAASLSGLPRRKNGYGPQAPGIVTVPYPQCCGCPDRERCKAGSFPCLARLEQQYCCGSAQDAAAVIVEPYLGSCIAVPPKGYLKTLYQWAKSKGMLFIMDEVQAGMGRTGAMYCYQREEIQPDMLLLGKALGNGMHISALLVKDLPEKAFLGPVSGGVGDETLACTAACEVFRQLEDGLLEHVRSVGAQLVSGLEKLRQYPCVADARGMGLAAAIELRTQENSSYICKELKKQGYFVGLTGKSIFFKPPYVVTESQIMSMLTALEKIIQNI